MFNPTPTPNPDHMAGNHDLSCIYGPNSNYYGFNDERDDQCHSNIGYKKMTSQPNIYVLWHTSCNDNYKQVYNIV